MLMRIRIRRSCVPLSIALVALIDSVEALPQQQNTSRHPIVIVVPHGSGGTVTAVDASGRSRSLPPDSAEPVDVQFGTGRASVAFTYASGLTLMTSVRSYEERLVLPELVTFRMNIRDSYTLGISGARVVLHGGGGRFAWSSEAASPAMQYDSCTRNSQSIRVADIHSKCNQLWKNQPLFIRPDRCHKSQSRRVCEGHACPPSAKLDIHRLRTVRRK